MEGEEQLCLYCLCHLPHTGFYKETPNPVEQLLIDREKLVCATAFLYYEKGSQVQRLIHALKYDNNKELGYLLGRQAAQELKEAGHPICQADLILPIPLHPRKQRKRGYNQSEWIARGLSDILKIPLHTQAVKRNIHTESQTTQTGYNRWLNVKDIFTLTKEEELRGKHILLVDDVITSGSTAGACIDTLSQVADCRISFFTLSIAHL